MRRRRQRLSRKLLLACVAAAAAAGVAAGSPLGAIANAQIDAAAPSCAAHGFTVAYSTAGSTVTAVRVGSIAAADCRGAALLVTITDRNGNAVAQAGPQAVPAAGTALTLRLDAPLAVARAAGVEVSVAGA